MKLVLCFTLMLNCLIVAGCMSSTPPIFMDNGIQRKIITRCDNDVFCFKKPVYDVTWDSSCQSGCGYYKSGCGAWNSDHVSNYPVSYRSYEYVYANDPHGYAVTLPAGGNVITNREESKGAVNE